tara:strand:- start:290 stop:988 length:699 start_codon:yes stop_codon:yes gene_type:complete
MTNSDNTFGVYNKITQILSQTDIINSSPIPREDGSTFHGDGSTTPTQKFDISAITLNNPIRITTDTAHSLNDKSKVTFTDIGGTTELNSNTYYAKKIDTKNFDLYSDYALSTKVDGTSSFTTYDDDGSGRIAYVLAKTVFANTDDAMDFYLTSDAQACFTECGTTLQWALVNDDDGNATSLKVTVAFGVVADSDTAGWGTTFNSRKATLIDNNGWEPSGSYYTATDSSDHLF